MAPAGFASAAPQVWWMQWHASNESVEHSLLNTSLQLEQEGVRGHACITEHANKLWAVSPGEACVMQARSCRAGCTQPAMRAGMFEGCQ